MDDLIALLPWLGVGSAALLIGALLVFLALLIRRR